MHSVANRYDAAEKCRNKRQHVEFGVDNELWYLSVVISRLFYCPQSDCNTARSFYFRLFLFEWNMFESFLVCYF